MSDWNSKQYLKFKNERTQPSKDLAARLGSRSPKKLIDIGCGPGNSTAVLKSRYPSAYIVGADFSPDMIDRARAEHPDIEFIIFDAQKDFSALDNDFDIVFSNACIQWIPNHNKLLRDMMGVLKPGGELAVQIPCQREQPMHTIVRSVAAREKWKEHFSWENVFNILTAEEYYGLLAQLSSDFSMWKTVYYHRMPSHQSIIEWYRSTGLKPYFDALPQELHADFEQDVLSEVKSAYPQQKNGDVIFRFPRLFFTAVK